MTCCTQSSRGASVVRHATAALLFAGLASPALSQSSAKRGMAGGGYERANAANASWYYHWSNDPNGSADHAPILSGAMHGQYTPMIWGGNLGNLQPKINRILGYKDALGVEYVMGFNEPERPDQANKTVAEALAMWEQMDLQLAQGAGLKLVSPAVSDNLAGRNWLADFMAQASANNYQVDAVAFHWYGNININNPAGTANNFLSRVDDYYNTYGLPVWITEFAGMDWNTQYTSQQMIDFNEAFLDVVIPGLESRSYVERYSWWQFGLPNTPGRDVDSQLFEQVNGVWTPTVLGDTHVQTLLEGDTRNLNGASTGTDTHYFRGGLLTNTNTASPSVIYAIDAIEGDSEIGAAANAQTIVSDGTVRVRSGATLTKVYSGNVVFEDVRFINEGVIEVRQGAELAGALSFAGDGSGDFVVAGNGVLLVSGDVSAMHNGLVIESGGVVNFEPTDAGTMTGGIEVKPGGSLRIGAPGQGGNTFPDTPSGFQNDGTVRVFDSETIRNMTGDGVLFAEEELVLLQSNPGFDGEIGVRDGATLRALNADGLGSAAGKTVVYGDQQTGVLELASNLVTHAEPLELRGRQQSAINEPHVVNVAGNNTWAGPITLEVSGTRWTIRSDAGLLTLSGGIVSSPGTLGRTLKLDGAGDGVFTAPITMNPSADNTLDKSGTGTWSINDVSSGFNAVQVNAGVLAINQTFHAQSVSVNAGGTLGGGGGVIASVSVNAGGTVAPGSDTNADAMTIGQDVAFLAGSVLDTTVNLPFFPGNLYDQLLVTGTLTIEPGATLRVSLGGNYTPALGDRVDLLDWGTLVGGFDQFELPTLGTGLAWDTSSLTIDGSLGVVVALPGDTDGDGDIDDADLGTAFANYTGPVGSAGNKTAAQGDTDADADVDDSDLGTAFAGYTGPLSPTPGANVPEPTTLALLGLGGLTALRRRR
ncbi:MAG: glycosyl hydrolase [Phycisphaeraceae bacterium]